MNKTELKAAWGKYCDIDKLADTTMALLKKHNHRNTEHGVCTMLNEYFTNKRELIDTLASSPNYLGDMRIMVDIELERTVNRGAVTTFCNEFISRMHLRELCITKVDEHGKTLADYEANGVQSFNAKDLLKDSMAMMFVENAKHRRKFKPNGDLISSIDSFDRLHGLFYYGFGSTVMPTISSGIIDRAAVLEPPVKLHEGMKTSRAFNKVCTEYGIDKAWPTTSTDENGNTRTTYPYDKLFAEYSDMISGTKRKLKFFISVNPLDYLTMSFGNSWSSCHSISKHGGWCGGCVSYMLDSSSIITYAHTDVPESCEEGKIYRNMFHYKNGAVLQSRIYPQDNDGKTNLYNEFWKTFTKEFSPLIGVSADSWNSKRGNYSNQIKSTGVHYPDYSHHQFMFYTTKEIDGANKTTIPIGHKRICTYCGKTTDDFTSSSTAHDNCRI